MSQQQLWSKESETFHLDMTDNYHTGGMEHFTNQQDQSNFNALKILDIDSTTKK